MKQPLFILDLFSGIGAFSLGLERTGGFKTVCFCEWDKKAQLVLNKHWPDVPVAGDIKHMTVAKTIDAKDKPRNYIELWYEGTLLYTGLINVITGGWPCQDISLAGNMAGIKGSRSGHFFDAIRIAGSIMPDYILMENVSNLLSISDGRDFGTVLTELDTIGFDAEWHCIQAADLGAPHIRDRIWVLAHPYHYGPIHRQDEVFSTKRGRTSQCDTTSSCSPLADTACQQCNGGEHDKHKETRNLQKKTRGKGCSLSYTNEQRAQVSAEWGFAAKQITRCLSSERGDRIREFWSTEPSVGRVADGVPGRVDRLKQLGNSLIPQIPEMFGYAILEQDGA